MENVSRGTTKNLRDHCPLCNHDKVDFKITCEDYTVSHELFEVVTCKNCGLNFTQDVPTIETIGSFYKSDTYISHSDQKSGLINSLYGVVRNYTLRQKLGWINKHCSGQSIFDLGAGTGYFVNTLQKGGWDVTGFEPDQDARSVALKNFNIQLEEEAAFYAQPKIENLSMWHVLEHVYDLPKFLNFVKEKMVSGGTWIFAVPNCESWDANHYQNFWAAWDLPRHLYHFKKDQVRWIAEKFDFEVEKIIPMHFDAFYVSMLSEKYKGGNFFNALINAYRSEVFANGVNNSSLVYVLKKK